MTPYCPIKAVARTNTAPGNCPGLWWLVDEGGGQEPTEGGAASLPGRQPREPFEARPGPHQCLRSPCQGLGLIISRN